MIECMISGRFLRYILYIDIMKYIPKYPNFDQKYAERKILIFVILIMHVILNMHFCNYNYYCYNKYRPINKYI